MKILKMSALVLGWGLLAASVRAEYGGGVPQEPSPGIEYRRIGGNQTKRVPEGAKTIQIDGNITRFESNKEYMARNFKETDERLDKIEQEQLRIIEELKKLQETLQKILQNIKQ